MYHSGIGGNERRAFAQKLPKHDAVERRRQAASAASSTVSFSTTRDARTIAGVQTSPSSSTCCSDVVEPLDFEEFLEAHQLELASDELRDLLDSPPDDIDVGIIQRRYRTVRPLAPDKHEIGSLDLHVQECVRHYLSDWVYAHRRYSEFGSAGIYQRSLETQVQTSAELYQEYEVDGVVEFSISNGASKSTPSSSARSSMLMADTPRGSWASHFDLKNSTADALLPSLLDRVPTDTLDRLNEARRQQGRLGSLFSLYPPEDEEDVIERRAAPPLPAEHRGHRILVKCLQLKLEVTIEPIFASMALYDAGRKKKISENFYFDMNSEQMKSMMRDHVPYVDISTLSKSCIFDITYPSADLFLVIKLEKVMQGDINECAEPYINDKSREKAHAVAAGFCERLGQYRMPFAWTAIFLTNIVDGINSLEREAGDRDTSSNPNSLERKSSQSSFDQFRKRPAAGEGGGGSGGLGRRGSFERRSFSERRTLTPEQFGQSLQTFRPVTLTVASFFKQESDRLKEEDLFKHLQDLKRPSSGLKKLKCIGGTLKLDISPCPDEVKNCLTPELAKIRPYPAVPLEGDDYDKCRPCKELLEFPSQAVYEPHFLYRSVLFVSPKSVNFTNYPNKPGISARNIAVRVQFLNGEGAGAPMPVIFGRSSMPEFVSEAHTAVSYHNKMPDFYDEIKLKLPANLTDAHHLLFTFFHISCQPRKQEQTSAATPIGYTWLPVFRDGRLNTGDACLPVLLEPPPPNYPYITPDINLPGVKWVDNHRPLFSVSITAETSVHAQDKGIDSFLSMCRVVESGVVPPRIGENNVEAELNRSIQQLSESDPERLVINTGQPCFQAIGQLVQRVSDLLESRNDQHGRNALLMTYVRYQCTLPQGAAEPVLGGLSPPHSPAYVGRASSLPRARTFSRSTSNPNMAAPLDADSEVGQILSRALDRTASLRTVLEELHEGVSQELLVSSRTATTRKVVHEELALQWVVSSGRSRELAMLNPWFFFELMFKSMLCHLASSGRMEAPRRYRFPERFADDVTTLVTSITNDIVSRQTRDNREVTRDVSRLNAALAFFINDLLSVMDRTFLLGLRRALAADPAQLTHLKLDFLRIVCSHEHYFSLNLPLATPLSSAQPAASPTPSVGSASSQSSYLSSTLVANERPRFAELSAEFRQQHFLAGLVLSELDLVLRGSNSGTHSKAVSVDPTAPRRRVALLYLPLLPVVLDNLEHVHDWSAQGRGGYLSREGGTLGAQLLNGGRDAAGDDAARDAQSGLSGIRPETSRDLLTCVLWVLKNTRADVLRATWAEYRPSRIQLLLRLLHTAVSCFEYKVGSPSAMSQVRVTICADRPEVGKSMSR
ncbi:dedicator of cytokinesis protein 7-like [Pollicipes pollicipes]|uniref:dedicator of cytokinesis protein 7-like n=1 Tax=Pollicipes pollicipes TaxID=41117 RepID=UPI0018857C21|nr:dedicator of cytokinesis protein 7-like [Pollicipes pollicipes]